MRDSSVEIIAQALGRAQRNGQGWLACCPAHHDHNPSLSLRAGRNGLMVHCFAGCSYGAIMAALRERGLYSGQLPDAHPLHNRSEKNDNHNIASAREIWRQCRPITDTLVVRYLASRGLVAPETGVLGYHAGLWHSSGSKYPAMVALVQHGVSGAPIGIHRTYLAAHCCSKAPISPNKMMLGSVSGGAVQFAPAGKELIVAEGIETALSILQTTGLPTWAALSAAGIEALSLPPLPLAETIIIAADNDASGRGQCAAEKAAKRWNAQGRKVRIAKPAETNTDFNDLLRSK